MDWVFWGEVFSNRNCLTSAVFLLFWSLGLFFFVSFSFVFVCLSFLLSWGGSLVQFQFKPTNMLLCAYPAKRERCIRNRPPVGCKLVPQDEACFPCSHLQADPTALKWRADIPPPLPKKKGAVTHLIVSE